jgi:signal transduction histidine kinase/ligand-binding sensor domain-containing protein
VNPLHAVAGAARPAQRRARIILAGVATACAWLALSGSGRAQAASAAPAARALTTEDDYRILHWTTAQGLPQSTVNDIVLLSNGELWLATFGGLARFDGHGFRVVDIAGDEELPSNRIVSIAAAGADAFWFLTQQGHLGRVARGRAASLVPRPGGSVDFISLLADPAGPLYAKSVDGTVWRTDGAQPWRQVLAGAGPGGVLHAFAVAEGGSIWATWEDRLVPLNGAAPGLSVPVPERNTDLFPRVGGGLWLGMEQGIGRVVDGRFEREEVRPAITGRVAAIESAGADRLWAASGGSVSRLDRRSDGSWRRVTLLEGLTGGMFIRSLKLDGEGNVWIGTNGSGLYCLNRVAATQLRGGTRLAEITALATDGAAGAFVASGCRGLFHLDSAGVATPIPLRDPSDAEGIVGGPCGISLGAAGGDRVWARADSHVFLVRRQGLEVRRLPVSLPGVEGPVAANTDGTLWVVSRTGSAHLLSPEGVVIRELHLQAPLVSASRGPDGALWVGGDGEVFRVGPRGVERFGPAEHVPRGLIRDVVPEADGTVWIGSYGGGVGRLRAGRVARLTDEHGLPDNSVSRILDDRRGRTWISTNRGLVVVERRDLHAAADGRLPVLAPVVLGPERGFAEANFGSPAGFAGPGGHLWFGTIEGVARLDAARFPFDSAPPGVRIEGVWADNRPVPLGATVRIPPLTTRVHAAFTTFELIYPERTRFRYRVEGLDDDWVDIGAERSLDWTPPGPGLYRVLLEARNEDGVWSAAPAEIVLEVLPAWWQTLPFRLAAILTAVLATFGAFRLRIRSIERRHAERLRVLEEQREAEERIAAMRAQLEHVARVALAGELAASLAHEVSQPLGAIMNDAEAGRRHLTQYLQRPEELAAIFGDIVDNGIRASAVVRGLRSFLRPRAAEVSRLGLSGLVRETLPLVRRELADNRVRTTLELDEALPEVEGNRVQLGQVLVNLLMNACEALAGIDGDRQITIATRLRNGRAELAVRDNGPGLDPEIAARVFEPFVTTRPDGLGMGLAVCRAIAEAHAGHLRAEAAPGGGMEVTLSLPVAPGEES